jgi:hypothetical protein
MQGRFVDFLIDRTGSAPRNLGESIRRVQDCSSGFRRSWPQRQGDAYATSQEAFEHLDYIQNELLRRRDAKSDEPSWSESLLKSALDAPVGSIVTSICSADEVWFASLPEGHGAIPPNSVPSDLRLGVALNKLKHRSASIFNFSLPPNGLHLVHVFATAGMGQPSSISQIDIDRFCEACRTAASHA